MLAKAPRDRLNRTARRRRVRGTTLLIDQQGRVPLQSAGAQSHARPEVAMNRPALDRAVLVLVLAASVALLLPSAAAAQGTPADYARAQKLRATYESLAVDIAGPATAIGKTHRFWYRKTVRGAEQFVVVDADTQQRQPAFDHEQDRGVALEGRRQHATRRRRCRSTRSRSRPTARRSPSTSKAPRTAARLPTRRAARRKPALARRGTRRRTPPPGRQPAPVARRPMGSAHQQLQRRRFVRRVRAPRRASAPTARKATPTSCRRSPGRRTRRRLRPTG